MNELWKMTATDLAARVRAREVSAQEVTKSALDRLAAVNPRINAVVDEFPEEALAVARDIDDALGRGEDPGELVGVPVTVKVNVDQQGRATTNGLKIQRELIAETDNPVVANLRRAGAVIIGRTNTPAFSLRWFTRNVLHGQTYNPRNRGLTPGGSSGGAAAAVASGIGAIAHGTDIAGSIRYPAYACGVHGLRPSFGRIPSVNASGPERQIGGQLMAVSGPLARSIADLGLAFRAMAREDPRDPWWVGAPLDFERDPETPRVALAFEPDGLVVAPAVKEALCRAAERLEAAGWEVEEIESPPLREAASINLRLWLAEIRKVGLSAIAREGDADAEFVFGQLCRHSPPTDLDGLLEALQRRATLVREWQLFLHRYTVLLCPVSSELPFPDQSDLESQDAFDGVLEAQLTQLALPVIGVPALTVSTGSVCGVPVGVQLVAKRYREDVLLEAGHIIESLAETSAPVEPV